MLSAAGLDFSSLPKVARSDWPKTGTSGSHEVSVLSIGKVMKSLLLPRRVVDVCSAKENRFQGGLIVLGSIHTEIDRTAGGPHRSAYNE